MNAGFRTPEEVFSWAEGFTNLEKGSLPFDKRTYRLDRMRELLEIFDNPQRSFQSFHVAGTKGKGSTAALMAAALHASGEKTGLYASPHVRSPLERISVSGGPPDPGLFAATGSEVRERIEALRARDLPGVFRPTTFELFTLLAFLTFRAARCGTAVIETGIGGRLDATNVVTPVASVITPLDLEHTEVLGSTIEEIAAEKAGIIKEGKPAFIGFQAESAREVFLAEGARKGSPLVFLDEEMEFLDAALGDDGTRFRVKLRGMLEDELCLSMLGRFQAENAALAYMALRRIRPELSREAIRAGFLRARLPGRFELAGRAPPLVLDAAHTPLAVRRLLESFREIFPGDAILLFGSVAGKRPEEMAEILAPAFRRIIISTPGTFKASDPDGLFAIFSAVNPETILEKDPAAAFRKAGEESGGKLPILVTGSFYMIAEVCKLLE
jgi:dihydrofolate synthase/folylpolyglutamate synthase